MKKKRKTTSQQYESISNFIVWDFLKLQKKRGFAGFEKVVYNMIYSCSKEAKKYYWMVACLDKIYNSLIKIFLKKQKKDKKIFFRGVRFPQLILETRKKYSTELVVSGMNDRLFAIKHFLPYISVSDLYSFIQKYIDYKDEKYLHNVVEILEKRLENRIKTTNKMYMILWSDSFPLERTLVLASRNIGITTIQVQEGMYSAKYLIDNGLVSDYVFVWGEFFKQLYKKQKIKKPEDFFILGYPYNLEKVKKIEKKWKYKVVYLGQCFENLDKRLLKPKLEAVKGIKEECDKLGMEFIYKPHPNDNLILLKNKLPGINFTKDGEILKKTIKTGDIFISLVSTALIEAALNSKICIQLRNYPLPIENFEKLGICKSFKKTKDLGRFLKVLKESKLKSGKIGVSKKYITLPKNPDKKFLQLLEKINGIF
jgi:hypothetical protein